MSPYIDRIYAEGKTSLNIEHRLSASDGSNLGPFPSASPSRDDARPVDCAGGSSWSDVYRNIYLPRDSASPCLSNSGKSTRRTPCALSHHHTTRDSVS